MTKAENVIEDRVSCPAETLDTCLKLIEQVAQAKGTATPVHKKDIAVIAGKSESAMILKLSASVQYGLLVSHYGKGYQPSGLFQRINMPESDVAKRNSLIEALKSPSIYNSLIEKYNGQVLPQEAGLANTLVLDFKVNKAASERAAKVFFDNCKYLGVIDQNNKLRLITNLNAPPNGKEPEKNTDKGGLENQPSGDQSLFSQTISLSGNKVAYLNYPKSSMTSKDIEILKIMVNAIMTTLELSVKKEE